MTARSEDGDNSGKFNIKLNLIEGRSLVRYRKVNRTLDIDLWKLASLEMGGVKPSPISSELELK